MVSDGKHKLFVSYSHRDEAWFERFSDVLRAACHLDVWSDTRLEASDDWDTAIQTSIDDARMALLLVSPAFLSSEYVMNRELPRIFDAAAQERLQIMWVPVEPVPKSILPTELQSIQTFKFRDSDATSLEEQSSGQAAAEICRISERIIQRLEYKHDSHFELYKSVEDAVWRIGYSGLELVARGDYSLVFRAKRPGSEVAIKALIKSPLDDWDDPLGAERLEKAQDLASPTFIKIRRSILDREPRLLVTEWAEVTTLRQHMQASKKLMPVDHVRCIVGAIAGALAEYHRHELVYAVFRPEDILLETTGGRAADVEACPRPRLSSYRFGQMALAVKRGAAQLDNEYLTYMTPEQYEGGVLTEKSDQYCLALLAMEMLQGEPPVTVHRLADLQETMVFFDDPEKYARKMLHRAPRLTRVILKMLSRKPEDRYASMREVMREIGSGSTVEEVNRSLAKLSYNEVVRGDDAFYEKFYGYLLDDRHAHLREHFRDVDWSLQHPKLDAAVINLLNFSTALSQPPPTLLSGTVKSHRRYGLRKADFTHFRNSFLKALRDSGEDDEEIQLAWRKTLDLGIDHMKKYATRKAT